MCRAAVSTSDVSSCVPTHGARSSSRTWTPEADWCTAAYASSLGTPNTHAVTSPPAASTQPVVVTARRAEGFRLPIVAYPLGVAVVWVPSVLLGVVGSADVPGLQGAAAGSILVRLIQSHAPELLAGLLAAGVFAAIMSSQDSQPLSLGTVFTQDIVRH